MKTVPSAPLAMAMSDIVPMWFCRNSRHNGHMRRRRITGALVAVTTILLLSGCIRFQADLTVTPENTLNGHIVVATVVGDGANAKDDANGRAVSIEQKLLPNLSGADGVTRRAYDEDGYAGSRFSLNETPLDALNSDNEDGSLTLKRKGDTFVFTGAINFTPDREDTSPKEGEESDESDIQVAISFPGTVTEHNGTLSGNKVTWNTSYEGSLDMHAVASAESAAPKAWVWVLIGLGSVVLIVVIVVVVLRPKRRNGSSVARKAGSNPVNPV